ncbi:MerR family transcriptional regulator [Galactobacter sp.]|uniref:MerR family transcriptional regulator n=1 Tax=Galactobacter sp. TaxID=2676125 RepID=UPI0025BE7637|nr:MerR family transcriptional regulator [Galactobacter sp.]
MLSIGAFAQVGQVTHRQLRHWDAAGLLVPTHVDEFTGYRTYDPSQLERLHRIVALRELGFGLDDIALMLKQGVDVAQMEELLTSRRDRVEEEHRLATARLVDVEHRLRLIERKLIMPTIEIVRKPLPALRLAARSGTVQEQPQIASIVGPAFDAVAQIIGEECGALDVAVASYDEAEGGIRVVAGYGYAGEAQPGLEIVELPAVPEAFVGVHLGSMDTIHESWAAVHGEIIAKGFIPDGPCRENYLRAEGDDQSDWVTELQQPVRRA